MHGWITHAPNVRPGISSRRAPGCSRKARQPSHDPSTQLTTFGSRYERSTLRQCGKSTHSVLILTHQHVPPRPTPTQVTLSIKLRIACTHAFPRSQPRAQQNMTNPNAGCLGPAPPAPNKSTISAIPPTDLARRIKSHPRNALSSNRLSGRRASTKCAGAATSREHGSLRASGCQRGLHKRRAP